MTKRGCHGRRRAALQAIRLVLIERGRAFRAQGHKRLRRCLGLTAGGIDRWLDFGGLIRSVVGERHVIVAHCPSSGMVMTWVSLSASGL